MNYLSFHMFRLFMLKLKCINSRSTLWRLSWSTWRKSKRPWWQIVSVAENWQLYLPQPLWSAAPAWSLAWTQQCLHCRYFSSCSSDWPAALGNLSSRHPAYTALTRHSHHFSKLTDRYTNLCRLSAQLGLSNSACPNVWTAVRYTAGWDLCHSMRAGRF